MRELFIKYFGRILAVLGCSTVVTACYGVPADPFYVKGKVTDAETDMPIEGIQVRVTSAQSNGGTSGVSTAFPSGECSGDLFTSDDGRFSTTLYDYGAPDVFIIECKDVDGDMNGSYMPATTVIPFDESEKAVIKLEKVPE